MVAGVVEGVRARKGGDDRTLILPISGGMSVYGGPNSPMNKVIGLGLDGPIDLETLEEIEREWGARDEAVRVEVVDSRGSVDPCGAVGTRVSRAWIRKRARAAARRRSCRAGGTAAVRAGTDDRAAA